MDSTMEERRGGGEGEPGEIRAEQSADEGGGVERDIVPVIVSIRLQRGKSRGGAITLGLRNATDGQELMLKRTRGTTFGPMDDWN